MLFIPSTSPLPVATWVIIALGIGYVILWRKKATNLPPGPRPLPLIGNAHQVPLDCPERRFAEWGHKYGYIVFIRVLGRSILIVNSLQAALDLMEKRSAKYSDRPTSVIFTDLLGWGETVPLINTGPRLKKVLRWFHTSFFTKASLEQAEPTQAREVQLLLCKLAREPNRIFDHIHRFSSSLVLERLYAHTVTSDDDEYMRYAEAAVTITTKLASPGTSIVDFIPLLRHIPMWMPGSGFKREAAIARAALKRAYTELYALVQRKIDTGEEKPSFVRTLIEEHTAQGNLGDNEEDIMRTGVAAYIAGVDTTQSALRTFLLAMVLYPDVYAKAQAEIDRVVGNERLPVHGDRHALPYLECVLREVYRWHTITPLGIPHALSEDDEYRGYHLPKGCVIIPNMWYMARDPTVYPDPSAFRPERFWGLSDAEVESICPRNIIFGFGRRICAGRRFVDATLWLALACMIATFDIKRARNAAGEEISVVPEFTANGAVSHAKEFPCSITPRKIAERALASVMGLEAHGH